VALSVLGVGVSPPAPSAFQAAISPHCPDGKFWPRLGDGARMTQDHPMPENQKHKPSSEKPHRLHLGGFSVWTALLGAVLTIVGTAIAVEQAHLATVENNASERSSLVSVVTDIAQLTRTEATAPSDQIAAIHEAGDADAAQGLALVDALQDRVPAIDNLELGSAFEASGEFHEALVSFARAASDATDPGYRSKALRAAAAISYYIGGRNNDLAAARDIAQAYHAFDRQPDVPGPQADANRELANLWDARFVASSDCDRARTEVDESADLIATDRASADLAVEEDLEDARVAVKRCTQGLPIPVTTPYVPAS
jgi:hypothetical protein